MNDMHGIAQLSANEDNLGSPGRMDSLRIYLEHTRNTTLMCST